MSVEKTILTFLGLIIYLTSYQFNVLANDPPPIIPPRPFPPPLPPRPKRPIQLPVGIAPVQLRSQAGPQTHDNVHFIKEFLDKIKKISDLEIDSTSITIEKRKVSTNISFGGVQVPVVFVLNEGVSRLKLNVFPKKTGSQGSSEKELFIMPCLAFEIDVENSKGEVDDINTGSEDCPTPVVAHGSVETKEKGKGRGNFLLSFVDYLSKSLNLKSVALTDYSVVSCDLDPSSVQLGFLHIMRKGVTWYESKGYQPLEIDNAEYRSKVTELRNLPLNILWDDLQENITNLKKLGNGTIMASYLREKSTRNHYKELIENTDRLQKMKEIHSEFMTKWQKDHEIDQLNPHVSDFYAWLWENHCDEFNKFQDYFFPVFKEVVTSQNLKALGVFRPYQLLFSDVASAYSSMIKKYGSDDVSELIPACFKSDRETLNNTINFIEKFLKIIDPDQGLLLGD